MKKDRSEESGATTVLVALLAISLFMVGALAVDLGHVYAKRSAHQSNVDMAVLAAAAKLTQGNGCNSEVVATAVSFLNKTENRTPDQPAATSGGLTSGGPGDLDGYIRCQNWRVELWAPRAHVEYGLAKAFDDGDGLEVPAFAAAQIRSQRFATLPMYAVSGCIAPRVQITDPPNSQPGNLAKPTFPQPLRTHTNYVRQQPTPDEFTDAEVAAPPVSTEVRLQTVLAPGSQIVLTPDADLSLVVPASNVTLVSAPTNRYSIQLPAAVLDAPGVWWLRVRSVLNNYSPDAQAIAIIVGDLLACNGSLSGNFGTLKLARSTTNFEIERNLILGVEPELALYPSATATTCPVAQSEKTPTSPTDCLSTDPGFPIAALTRGLVTGIPGLNGRLDAPTTPGCSRNGTSSQTPGSFALNDDTLQCFIVDPTATIADIQAGTKPRALSPDIVKSVRFFQIPELPIDPSQGTSNNYPIRNFHYVFISAESPVTGYNGLSISGSKVTSLTLTFIHRDSMPETLPSAGGEIDYLGYGPKVVVLVD